MSVTSQTLLNGFEEMVGAVCGIGKEIAAKYYDAILGLKANKIDLDTATKLLKEWIAEYKTVITCPVCGNKLPYCAYCLFCGTKLNVSSPFSQNSQQDIIFHNLMRGSTIADVIKLLEKTFPDIKGNWKTKITSYIYNWRCHFKWKITVDKAKDTVKFL